MQVQSKRLEAELQDKMEHLERAKCLQSELLPNMSHELRTLLTSMLVLSHVLVVQADERFSEKERSYLKIIERNGQRLLSLVNDTLDISKVQAGKMPVSVEVFSLRSTTAEIVERLIAMAEGKGIVIEHEIPDNMHIESDRRKVEQAMQNIIWNAVKFTEKGQVTISARADESNTYIDVTDTGIGMAQADLPYIFDDFRQVCGNSPAHFEGTGLGLAIAKTFTEMLGGTISVVSKVGEGSTFTLTLPTKWQGSVEALRRPALRQQAKRSKETVLTAADGPDAAEITATNIGGSPRPKILLVEDNPDDRTALQAVLGGRYVLVEAHDGEQALASISRERPDLVLLDMALPGMDGLAVAQRIRENEKTGEMPVIVLTARAMTYDREKTLAAGCDDYVSKPFDAERLLAKVAHFLGEAAVSSSNGTVEGLASEAGQSGRIRLDQELASSKPDEASEDDLEEHRAQPMECQTQSGAEEGMSLGVCPATTSTAQDGTARWGALVTELRRLIADVVRLCRRKDPSKGRDTRRVARIEKRLRKFIETD